MKCPDCGKEFSALGRHLAFADCSPTVTSYQHDVLRGVLMSDGWVGTSGRCLQAEWANKKYAKYVSDELEWLCDGVQKRSNRDIWQLSTVSCDYIENNFSWYSSGQKRWPLNKKLTDDTLKHLYAGDGHLKQREGRSDAMIISCENERDRLKTIAVWVESSGYPKPTPHISNAGSSVLYFNTEDTREILNRIAPVDGYEYKWGKHGN